MRPIKSDTHSHLIKRKKERTVETVRTLCDDRECRAASLYFIFHRQYRLVS
ncbi:hypothetical protein BRARA_J02185 [Brassica rapa]|uniref:Uncharacterized protein n=1 Tax=Brassica campestris TaxID=3711 RepID=A0A397XMD2_BRACM|nr:hypothetical protein BRARA_J02185 [Brassica rapa]